MTNVSISNRSLDEVFGAYNITAEKGNYPVHAFDQNGASVQIGEVVTKVYDGEKVQRHFFVPDLLSPIRVEGARQNGRANTYSLGPTSTAFKFVDHTQALAPLLDQGYTVKKQILTKGGMQMYALMEPPEPVVFRDPISWDQGGDLPQEHIIHQDLHEIRQSLAVTTSIRPGKALMYREGWFRTICTNGLVAEILGLWSLRMTHSSWKPVNLEGRISKIGAGYTDQQMMGPQVGTVEGGRKLIELLERINVVEPDTDDDADDDAPPRTLATVPFFAKKAVEPFMIQPAWYLVMVIAQLKMLVERSERREVFAMDILNAVTNPITAAASDNRGAAWRQLSRTGSITESMMNLVGVFSL